MGGNDDIAVRVGARMVAPDNDLGAQNGETYNPICMVLDVVCEVQIERGRGKQRPYVGSRVVPSLRSYFGR